MVATLFYVDALPDTGAVTEHQLLTGSDAAHRGGVETFVAVDDGQRAGLGQCVDVEQRPHHVRVPGD